MRGRAKTCMAMGNKSHYDPEHERVFVREMSGEYSLGHELKRLRDLPRVQKGANVTFQAGPQAFSKHFIASLGSPF